MNSKHYVSWERLYVKCRMRWIVSVFTMFWNKAISLLTIVLHFVSWSSFHLSLLNFARSPKNTKKHVHHEHPRLSTRRESRSIPLSTNSIPRITLCTVDFSYDCGRHYGVFCVLSAYVYASFASVFFNIDMVRCEKMAC